MMIPASSYSKAASIILNLSLQWCGRTYKR